jgi:hypothetical protein
MELTQEQLDTIINAVVVKTKEQFVLEMDTRLKDVITKPGLLEVMKLVSTKQDLEDLKNAIATSEAKTNEAITKIANETETKIQQLRTTPAENKAWYNRELI